MLSGHFERESLVPGMDFNEFAGKVVEVKSFGAKITELSGMTKEDIDARTRAKMLEALRRGEFPEINTNIEIFISKEAADTLTAAAAAFNPKQTSQAAAMVLLQEQAREAGQAGAYTPVSPMVDLALRFSPDPKVSQAFIQAAREAPDFQQKVADGELVSFTDAATKALRKLQVKYDPRIN